MKVVMVFIIVAPGLTFQSDACNDEVNGSQEYDQHPHPFHYHVDAQKHKHRRHNSKSKLLQSDELDSSNKKYNQKRPHKRPSKKHPHDCVCDCQSCDKLLKCCESICNKECDQSEQKNEVETQPGLSSGNLVFVPYPYPMMVPPPAMPAFPMPMPLPQFGNKTFSIGPNEHSTAPSIARYGQFNYGRRQSDLQKDPVLDLLQSLRHRQEYPNVNLRPVKRSQIPDYQEISDQLLDRLIMQRNVKNINSG